MHQEHLPDDAQPKASGRRSVALSQGPEPLSEFSSRLAIRMAQDIDAAVLGVLEERLPGGVPKDLGKLAGRLLRVTRRGSSSEMWLLDGRRIIDVDVAFSAGWAGYSITTY